MTEQLTITPIVTLEQAIQRLIHDLRIPEELRTALEVYQGLESDLNDLEMCMLPAEQTKSTQLLKTIRSSFVSVGQNCNSRSAAHEYRYSLNCGDAVVGQEINICLWRNEESLDWSIKINGLRHEHVTSEVMEALVECALIVAQTSLTKAMAQRPQ